jgi:hypothetical protein
MVYCNNNKILPKRSVSVIGLEMGNPQVGDAVTHIQKV